MSLTQEIFEEQISSVAICNEPGEMSVLQNHDVSATICQRNMPDGFQNWLDHLPERKLPSARVLTRVTDLNGTITAICNSVHVPYSAHRRFLINDATMLAEQFASMMKVDVLRIRFDVVKDNACRKFHTDAVKARLVCTYRGPGTEFGMAVNGVDPQQVFSVPTGSPMVLRGSLWPEVPRSGLVHRSPPIEGENIIRLVLVIDPIFDEAE